MNSKNSINILLAFSLALILIASGYKIGEYRTLHGSQIRPSYNIVNAQLSSEHQQELKNIDFNLFWDTWDRVEQKYVDKKKVDPQKMFYGAIKGMVASVDDPYTFFLTPEENQQSKDDLGGKFEGIGAQLGLKDTRIVIIAPLKNSPAVKAGLQSGDYIIKVDGAETKGWSLPQAVGKIRGTKGTSVKLTIDRAGKEIEKTLTREEIHVDSVELSFEKSANCKTACPNVAYLKLNQFGENTNDEWDKAVAEIQKRYQAKQISAMVLDLRDNPGGYLDSAVYLASEFLPEGKVIVKQESSSGDTKEYHALRPGKLLDIPLTVLINKGSASASEILGGALRDYKRALLIGEKSFGKGSVQEAVDLNQGAGLHVTVAKWILPNGDWIMGKGIEPDIKVDYKIDTGNTITKEKDTQLQKAIETVLQ